jgi:monothiol glutaredoxin
MNNHPIFDQIKQVIENNDVVLFMKGSATSPMCGFSSVVAQILQKLNVTFKDINILEDNELREAIKVFSDWPTIPQLYVKGEFIGGCDIVREMFSSGELQELLKEKNISIAG